LPDYLGNIPVPEIAPSGVFPLVPDYPHGRAQAPEVVIHQFGSGNAKIEQRFLLGTGAKRFTVRKARLREADRVALRDFWEQHYGPYGAFYYNAPNDDGQGTTQYTCRFANEPLSWEMLAAAVCSLGVTLIEIPSSSPTYTLNQTVNRFPPAALQQALLSQVQEIIPLIKIIPKEPGYPAIYVSDRRCTIGSQLYQARLLEFDGIAQSIGNEATRPGSSSAMPTASCARWPTTSISTGRRLSSRCSMWRPASSSTCGRARSSTGPLMPARSSTSAPPTASMS